MNITESSIATNVTERTGDHTSISLLSMKRETFGNLHLHLGEKVEQWLLAGGCASIYTEAATSFFVIWLHFLSRIDCFRMSEESQGGELEKEPKLSSWVHALHPESSLVSITWYPKRLKAGKSSSWNMEPTANQNIYSSLVAGFHSFTCSEIHDESCLRMVI